MIRKDYIQRYFDEMAKVLAAVLQLKNNNQPDKAEEKINDFSSDYLGIGLDEIIEVEHTEIINYLIEHKEFTLDHFKLLEDLLYHKYLMNPDHVRIKNIILEVMNYLTKEDKDFSLDRVNRINELSQ